MAAFVLVAALAAGGAPSTAVADDAPDSRFYLPFPTGQTVLVAQGNGGSISHRDPINFYAWDFGLHEGDPVWASAPGYVRAINTSPAQSGGLWVLIEHAPDLCSRYLHLSRIDVADGDGIAQGQQIGLAGSTATPTPHLHYVVEDCNWISKPSGFLEAGIPDTADEVTSANPPAPPFPVAPDPRRDHYRVERGGDDAWVTDATTARQSLVATLDQIDEITVWLGPGAAGRDVEISVALDGQGRNHLIGSRRTAPVPPFGPLVVTYDPPLNVQPATTYWLEVSSGDGLPIPLMRSRWDEYAAGAARIDAAGYVLTDVVARVSGDNGPPLDVPDAVGCDFNRDGRADVVVAAPAGDGGVAVIYGALGGPLTGQPQILGADVGGSFGAALACGDVDDDGYDDLAIAAPDATVGAAPQAGVVFVHRGGLNGLSLDPAWAFDQSLDLVPGIAEADDRFGAALVIGDFDGNGHADLAIGTPEEDLGVKVDAGAVYVAYWGPFGVTRWESRHQGSPGVSGATEPGDRFGAALAAADVDGDGDDDLVVGVPGEGIGTRVGAGMVHLLRGTPSGLSSSFEAWHQASPGIPGRAEAGDELGAALALGDFDGDDDVDLAVGAPGEGIGAEDGAGVVLVMMWDDGGWSASTARNWHQASPGVPGKAEAGDRLGAALAAGDFDGDGDDDLAIGTPGEAVGSIENAGALVVLWGSGSGLTAVRAEIVDQDTPGLGSFPQTGDSFSASLAAGDFQGDGWIDLVIGVPGDQVVLGPDEGRVHLVPGSASGLSWLATDDVYAALPGWSELGGGRLGAVVAL